jgi:hypothetical protein
MLEIGRAIMNPANRGWEFANHEVNVITPEARITLNIVHAIR